ncbi:hypothetical protein Y032_0026g1392 [Ancylostoma ceylanicum]|uniref:SXP/RAL-2 family protein Ani s 5-like cation-binding domain-containing protein n=1 Tax=Ancylostoma ceylanicum TaxID=53326 RepID=A0A016UVK7_9BILA|nr:hypothetical protein Y032_0026g1392 [Ancylostoma ceylanicum]
MNCQTTENPPNEKIRFFLHVQVYCCNMKFNSLKLLILLGVVVSTLGNPPAFGPPLDTPPPPFPFLEEVGYTAVQEFQKIFQDTSLSGFQWNGLLLSWAQRNNVTDSYLTFKNNLEREERKGEFNLVRCLEELRNFFYEYHRISNNLVYTWDQVQELRQELMKKLTRIQMRIAVRLSNLYTPGDIIWPPPVEDTFIQKPHPPPFGPRRGRGRRRLGPFGQRRMGPYPPQPRNFGQGPDGMEDERD